MTLDPIDLKTALSVVGYYRRAHELSKRPVPPAADRLAANLEALDALMSSVGHEPVVAQPHWLTTAEVAARLNISQRHARRIAVRIGQRIGHQLVVPADALPTEEDRCD
jgi:hypothetical protein